MTTPKWLLELFHKPGLTDICLNGAKEVFLDCGNGMEQWIPDPPNSLWQEEDMKTWVLDQLSHNGKTWDARNPFVDATIEPGFRLHVTFPPIAPKGILVSLRRNAHLSSPEAIPVSGTVRWRTSSLYPRLAEIVRRGESLLIAGATGSGKTTLASDLLAEVPSCERIIALEDTPELHPVHSHFLSLLSRPPNPDGYGEVSLRTLLKQTLRMRPDRIVLGECRGAEVLELLQALNTGHRGAIATLHANSARDALRRIELLCLLSSAGAIQLGAIRELLSIGIQWITYVQRHEGNRKIMELWHVEGREGDTILMRPMIQG